MPERGSNVETAGGSSGLGGKGCCKGQTGHHLIPSSAMYPHVTKNKVKVKDGKGCEKYDKAAHNAAPTVCVESANQHAGSHKRAHTTLAERMARAQEKGETKGMIFKEKLVKDNGTIDMDDMIEFAVDSHQNAFPLSLCSEKCIRAQLQDFYNKYCRNASTRMVGADGKPTGGDANDEDEDDVEMQVHAEDSGLLKPLAGPLRAWLAQQPAPAGRQIAGVPVEIAAQQLGRHPALSLPQCRQLAFQRTMPGQGGAVDASYAPML